MEHQTCEQCGKTCRFTHEQEHAELRVSGYSRIWALCDECARLLKEAIQKWRGEMR